MAANQLRSPSVLVGWPAFPFFNDSTLALPAAATWLAFQVVLDQTKTLSAVRLFLDTKTGTPTTAGCTCDLFSDASGIPNASTEGPISADSIPASGNWMGWTFAGTSVLTAGTAYWLVFKNGTGTPASNFPTYRWQGGASNNNLLGFGANSNLTPPSIMYGWNKVHTLNSGTAWASGIQASVGGIRLAFSDATYDGFPTQTITRASGGTTANRAFGKSEAGVRFNVPAGVTYNVRGLGFNIHKTSTPGNLRFRLYKNVTLAGTTNGIPVASVTTSTGDWYTDYFSSSISISSADNPIRVVFGDATGADANTVGYDTNVATFDSDSNSLALKPMNGTLQKTITADNTASPVVFTDTSTDVIPFGLILDTGGEFATPVERSKLVQGMGTY